jgi:hypothetical protein
MKAIVGIVTLTFAAMLAAASPAHAGSKYQTTLVPTTTASQPGFSAKGSSIKINGARALKGKIKKVVDGTGMLVTTDGTPSLDDYTVEVDLAVAATAMTGTVTVAFDLDNGNGKFAADISGDAVFTGAMLGDGVSVLGVRVKDSSGTVIGTGGFAIE